MANDLVGHPGEVRLMGCRTPARKMMRKKRRDVQRLQRAEAALTVRAAPHALLRHARYVLSELRRPNFKLSRKPDLSGVTFDPPGLVSEIEPEADALRSALTLFQERAADAALTQRARSKAKARLEDEYTPIVRILADLAKLGGARDLPGINRARRRSSR